MRALKILFYSALILILLGTIGRLDFDDEERLRVHACSMIDSGAWPSELREDC